MEFSGYAGLLTLFLISSCSNPDGLDASCVELDSRFQCDNVTVQFSAIHVAWQAQGQEPSSGKWYITIELLVSPSGPSTVDPFKLDSYSLELEDDSIWPAEGVRAPILAPGVAAGWLTFEVPTGMQARSLLWDFDHMTLRMPLPTDAPTP
jgi:hypothetical protein